MKSMRLCRMFSLFAFLMFLAVPKPQAAWNATDGNPESVLCLEAGNQSVTVSQPLMWYDDGGADGKISPRISATYTFTPSREGYAVTLNSTRFSIGNGKMYVYSGRKEAKDCLLGSLTGYGTTKGPENLVSKAADGSLTVVVTGPSGSTLDGFAIEVGLHEKVDYTLEDLTATSVSDDSGYMRGSRGLSLMKVAVEIAGDKGASKVSDIRFSLSGTDKLSDISALHLYYGADNDGFSPAICERLATVIPVSEEASFDVENEIGDNGVHYYYLAADVADDAVAGNKIAVALASVDFNGMRKDCVSGAVEGFVKAGLKGTFTVGASDADYVDFKSVAQALAQGVEGPVTFEILDGTYSECLRINDVKGSSAEHPVVFRSKSGNRDAVKIAGKYVASDKDGIVQVKGSPYVVLENVSVEAGSQGFSNAVYVGEKSPGFRMAGCSVTAAPVVSGYSGINLVRSHAVNEAGGNNDFMTIEDSYLEGGYIGLYLGGTGYVALPKEKGLVVKGNSVNGCYSKGIYVLDEDAPVIEGNTVSWSGSKRGYQAIDLYRMVNGASVICNRVYNTGAAYSTGVDFRDACVGGVADRIRFADNEVILTKSDAYSGRALNINNASANIDVDYKSFRVGGSDAYVMATNGSGSAKGIRVRGNIFHNGCSNVSTTLYFWNATDYNGFSFSGNAYWSAGGTVCKNDRDVLDMEGFKSLSGDDSAVSAQARFISDTDSHLAEAGEFRCGMPVEDITSDLAGTLRPVSGWTLGAYEYAPVSLEYPEMIEGYPSVHSVTENSVALKTRWNTGGTLYAIVKEWNDGDAFPDSEEVMEAKGVNVLADLETSTSFASLKPSTGYRAFFVAVSAAGLQSEVVASAAFTTLRHIGPLTLEFDDEETPRIESGEQFTIVPAVGGGDEPYVYSWTDQMGRQIGTESTLTVNPEVSQSYMLKVESADGQAVEAKTAVEVTGDMAVATFDDNYVAEDSHITPETEEERFYSGSFAFNAGGMPEYSFWYGYALSSETSPESSGLDDQFRSAPGGAFSGSNFAVGYPQGLTIDVTNDPEGAVVPGLYVSNSAYALSSMTNGDGFAKKFTAGDWFKLIAKATDAEGNTRTKDFYLADMRDASSAEHFILSSWEWMDLRSLGKVKSIMFDFDSSDKGTYGVNTPTYLCLDNFGSMPEMETRRISIPSGGSVDISGYFEEDGSEAMTVYSVEPLEEMPFQLNLEGSILNLDSPARVAGSEYECMASMRQRGKTRYARLLVSEDVNVGVGETVAAPVRIYPVPVVDRMNVSTSLSGYSVEVFAADGTCVFRSEGNEGDVAVVRDGWDAGIYIVRIASSEATVVRRVIVK